MDYLVELGNRIHLLRKKNNYTQEELALKVGYTSRSSINKIEKGLVDIPQSKVSELANALGVSTTYILFGDEPINEETPTPELTEGERAWLELYRKISPELRETYQWVVEKFDELTDSERQMLLAMISAAVKTK